MLEARNQGKTIVVRDKEDQSVHSQRASLWRRSPRPTSLDTFFAACKDLVLTVCGASPFTTHAPPTMASAASSSTARQHERKQIRHAFDGAKTGALFRSSHDKFSDPVSRRVMGLKIAGGVRIDVFVRARPPSEAEVEAGESVVVKVNPTKATVSMKYVTGGGEPDGAGKEGRRVWCAQPRTPINVHVCGVHATDLHTCSLRGTCMISILLYLHCDPRRMREAWSLHMRLRLERDRQSLGASLKSRSDAFTFDATFDGGSKQNDVYDTVGKPVVQEVLRGMNCCIMAYGQTGTGTGCVREHPDGLCGVDLTNVGCGSALAARRSDPRFPFDTPAAATSI